MIPKPNIPPDTAARLSFTIDEALAATGFGRTSFYALVASGELSTFTIGRRRYVPGDALRELIARRSSQGPISPETSQKRAEAGRQGRAAQLGEKSQGFVKRWKD